MSVAEEDILRFCQTREAIKDSMKGTREERQERFDAQKTTGNLLTDSMARHRVQHVRVGDRYVRCLPPSPRTPPIPSKEEALTLVGNLQVEGVSISDLPKHVISIVAARVKARSRVPDTAKPKLRIVASLPRRASAPLSVLPLSVDPLSVDPLSSASADPPPEVVRLATTYVEACDERKEQSRSLAPMRSDKKDLESGLKDQLAQPVVVQMSRGGRNVRLRISREEVPTKAKDVVGVRDFLRHVKEAVHTVAAEGPTVQDFQTRLSAALMERLSRPDEPKHRIVVKKI